MEQVQDSEASPELGNYEEVQDPGSGFPVVKNKQPPSISPDAVSSTVQRLPCQVCVGLPIPGAPLGIWAFLVEHQPA